LNFLLQNVAISTITSRLFVTNFIDRIFFPSILRLFAPNLLWLGNFGSLIILCLINKCNFIL